MPLALLANLPWKWICIGLALAGAVFAIDYNGVHRERAKWVAAENAKKLENIAAAKSQEDKWAAENARIEKDYLDARSRLDDLDRRYASSVARGLFDKQGTCKPRVPQAPGAAGSTPDTSTGCQLSSELSSALWDLARRADDAALYARAGHEYAVGK